MLALSSEWEFRPPGSDADGDVVSTVASWDDRRKSQALAAPLRGTRRHPNKVRLRKTTRHNFDGPAAISLGVSTTTSLQNSCSRKGGSKEMHFPIYVFFLSTTRLLSGYLLNFMARKREDVVWPARRGKLLHFFKPTPTLLPPFVQDILFIPSSPYSQGSSPYCPSFSWFVMAGNNPYPNLPLHLLIYFYVFIAAVVKFKRWNCCKLTLFWIFSLFSLAITSDYFLFLMLQTLYACCFISSLIDIILVPKNSLKFGHFSDFFSSAFSALTAYIWVSLSQASQPIICKTWILFVVWYVEDKMVPLLHLDSL